MPPKTIGDTVLIELNGQQRPVILTSLNADGTGNGRLIFEPDDNPTNDGNFPTFYRNLALS